MTAREAWAQVAHDLRILADDIDKAIESPATAGGPRTSPSVVRAGGGETPAVVPSGSAPLPPSFDELPPEDWQEAVANLPGAEFTMQESPERPVETGAAAMCPKHRKPYKDGRYGPFCTQTTDDPKWAKERDGKSWCTITPKNAHKWLQQRAGAAA